MCQGFCACTNLKIFVCIKNAFFLHFAKFCVLIFWNACFCSLIAILGCAKFSARFLSREQFGGNLVTFLWVLFLCCPVFSLFLFGCCCFIFDVVLLLWLLLLVLLLLVLLFFAVCCCCCCCYFFLSFLAFLLNQKKENTNKS